MVANENNDLTISPGMTNKIRLRSRRKERRESRAVKPGRLR